jgi:glycosyltransferase involved in cell wall biosynthesis
MSPFVRQPRREPIRSLGPDSQDLNSTQFSLRLTRFHTINGLSLANLDSSDSGSDLRLAWKPEQHAQRPMRILYDHQVFSLQDAGGASRYHFELVRHLQGLDGVELDVLLGLNASVMPFASLRQAGTSVLARATRIKPGLARYAINELLSSLAGPLQGKVDVYHPTLYRALPWVRRRRVVVTHHDCIHERFPQLFPDAASIIAAKRKLFAHADAIVCVSASSRSDLLHFYDLAENKTHVVPHGFTPLRLPPEDSPANGIPEKAAPYLLYVGSRAGYKNFRLLLEAFSRSGLAESYRLRAVGGGSFSAEERERIASLGLSGSITLIPKADDATLARAYRSAALFVYPSLYEGFGFPPLEAMSMGCPVLVNRTSSLPEVCGDAAFYFEASVAEDLSHSLVATLRDAEGLAEKRRRGEQQVRLYDWRRSARSTLDVYRTVLTG